MSLWYHPSVAGVKPIATKPLPRRETHGSNTAYHNELARQVAEFLDRPLQVGNGQEREGWKEGGGEWMGKGGSGRGRGWRRMGKREVSEGSGGERGEWSREGLEEDGQEGGE